MIEVRFTHACDVCDNRIVLLSNDSSYFPWTGIALPAIPLGWKFVGNKLVCPNHEVLITRDKNEEPRLCHRQV